LGLLWGYNVVAIDKEYKYALVAGGSLTIYGYCLVKSQPLEVTSDYLKIAEDIGYKTADLIWVNILNKSTNSVTKTDFI
jgi:apolipoprotein D and lipocalin family protein